MVAKFIHDTKRIICVNRDMCLLFRCEALALIDFDMVELIADEEFRGLARLRLRVMRERDNIDDMRPAKYPFRRCDGSAFWGSVMTRNLPDGHFETTIQYEYEE